MRRGFGQSLRVGVSARALALVAARRWGSGAPELLGEHVFGAEAPGPALMAAALRDLLAGAARPGWPVTIVIADELARIWQVTPPADATRLADLEAAAALRFHALYGEAASAWQISAGWDSTRPFVAAALPRALLEHLELALAPGAHTAVEIVPQFLAGFNHWRGALKPGHWYGLVHDDVLTLGVLHGGALQALRTAALPAAPSAAWLGEFAAREALRLNLEAPARLCISGAAPASWHSACTVLGSVDAAGSAGMGLAITGSRA